MVKIILEPADNGVIKKITDDNHGGARKTYKSTEVYEFNKEMFTGIIKFIWDLCEDCGIETGNEWDSSVISISTEWGKHYEASTKEIDDEILKLEFKIEALKKWKEEQNH